jgi:glycogen synthase kinase 3 beta
MNPDYQNKRLPSVQGLDWKNMFTEGTDEQLIDLVSKMLVYDPTKRINLYDALMHPCFDELR